MSEEEIEDMDEEIDLDLDEDGEGFEIVINPSCNVTDAKRCSLDFTPSN